MLIFVTPDHTIALETDPPVVGEDAFLNKIFTLEPRGDEIWYPFSFMNKLGATHLTQN